MRAWLVYNHSLNYEKFQEVHNLYIKAGEQLGIIIDLVANDEIISVLEQGSRELLCNHVYPDFVLFLDKDTRLAKQLEALGVPIFNSAQAIEQCDDKAVTMATLSDSDIPVPKTFIAPLSFNTGETPAYLGLVVQVIGLPCVVKESFGSFGEQVYLAETMEELEKISTEVGNKPHIYQEYIATSYGRDLRVYVAFGEVIFTVKRTNPNDFRANVTNGGTMEAWDASDFVKDAALASVEALGVDFAGVDILFGENDDPIVCEVNASAHIKNAMDVTGINFAESILAGILKKLEGKVEKCSD